MTCKEKLIMEYPGNEASYILDNECPHEYGYAQHIDGCNGECEKCWDSEAYDGNDSPKILDSGNRREFETGAVRDIQEGKGRCDLLPLDVIGDFYEFLVRGFTKSKKFDEPYWIIRDIADFVETGDTEYLMRVLSRIQFSFGKSEDMFLEVAKHFEDGAKKYGEHNWQKGIPARCYIDSAVRHYLKHLREDKDEPHGRAFVWNILCCIWTCNHMPELNDYAKENAE